MTVSICCNVETHRHDFGGEKEPLHLDFAWPVNPLDMLCKVLPLILFDFEIWHHSFNPFPSWCVFPSQTLSWGTMNIVNGEDYDKYVKDDNYDSDDNGENDDINHKNYTVDNVKIYSTAASFTPNHK